jgi:hypothetical protein
MTEKSHVCRCVVNTGALMIRHEFSGKINDIGRRNPLFLFSKTLKKNLVGGSVNRKI